MNAPQDEHHITPDLLQKVQTIGYRQPNGLEEIERLMTQEPTTLLVDIRLVPRSNNPEWTRQAFSNKYQERYLWLKSLGNVNHRKPDAAIQILDAKTGIEQLIDLLQTHSIILLCGCQHYESCHRKVVYDLLKQKLDTLEQNIHRNTSLEESNGRAGRDQRSNILSERTGSDVRAATPIRDNHHQPETDNQSSGDRERAEDARAIRLTSDDRSPERGDFPTQNPDSQPGTHHQNTGRTDTTTPTNDQDTTQKSCNPSEKLPKHQECMERSTETTPRHLEIALQSDQTTNRGDSPNSQLTEECAEPAEAVKTSCFLIVPDTDQHNHPLACTIARHTDDQEPPALAGTLPNANQPAAFYVDDIQFYPQTKLPQKEWCHLATTGTLEELHNFAAGIGLKHEWFQDKPTHPHYDLTKNKRAAATKHGAQTVSTIELIRLCHPRLAKLSTHIAEQLTPPEPAEIAASPGESLETLRADNIRLLATVDHERSQHHNWRARCLYEQPDQQDAIFQEYEPEWRAASEPQRYQYWRSAVHIAQDAEASRRQTEQENTSQHEQIARLKEKRSRTAQLLRMLRQQIEQERERRQIAERTANELQYRCMQAERDQNQQTIAGANLGDIQEILKNKELTPAQRIILPYFVEAIIEGGYEGGEEQPLDAEGRRRLNLGAIGGKAGMDASAISRFVDYAETQLPDKFDIVSHYERVPGVKKPVPRIYAKMKTPDILKHPKEIKPLEPRKQGGDRYNGLKCNKCNAQHYKVITVRKVQEVFECLECHHRTLLDEKSAKREKVYGTPPPDNTPETNKKQVVFYSDLPEQESEPTTNEPTKSEINDKLQGITSSNQHAERNLMVIHNEKKITSNPPLPVALNNQDAQPDGIRRAAELLLRIAGDASKHIVMPHNDPERRKYLDVARPLTLRDMIDHLKKGEARGALCGYQDGRTRAFCSDADTPHDWALLEVAARQLVEANYHALLDESPAEQRGGHLWVIFDGMVSAAAARHAILEIAPGLRGIKESWPAPALKGNRVRLPGAYYYRPGKDGQPTVEGWCKLTNVATGETANDGESAAALLLTSLTDSSIVPDLPSVSQDDQPAPQTPKARAIVAAASPEREEYFLEIERRLGFAIPRVDEKWEGKYGPIETTTCYAAIMPDLCARWYNKQNSLEAIRPKERNGLALSPNGSERSASTDYYTASDGSERYTDHSQHGKRPDGTRDTGDALELQQRLTGTPKPELMGMSTGQLVAKARTDLEAAARAGQPLPSWLVSPICIITPAGRAHYTELLEETGKQPAAVVPAIQAPRMHTQQRTAASDPEPGPQETKEKRIEVRDGVTLYVGWTDAEYQQHLFEDAQASHRARLWQQGPASGAAAKKPASQQRAKASGQQQATLL